MDRKKKVFFKKLLLERREKVVGELKHLEDENLKKSPKDASGDISGYAYHMADVATDNYNQSFNLDLATSEQKMLFEIDEALRRLKEGKFGICESCRTKIKQQRLKAVPHTHLCIACQEKKEEKAEG